MSARADQQIYNAGVATPNYVRPVKQTVTSKVAKRNYNLELKQMREGLRMLQREERMSQDTTQPPSETDPTKLSSTKDSNLKLIMANCQLERTAPYEKAHY